ncbi:hypothetical protein BDW75DRAFT_236590 [Aspergillus navahoensis]
MTSQSPATIRLHITPLNPELLPSVLPASIRSLASDISFHNIPTFPENNYGYVTLPTMEADKIKKKLNGSILKGRKFKVEPARPQKLQAAGSDDQNFTSTNKPPPAMKTKKRKAEENVLNGYELPSDRKVKRGWTESSADKTERRKKEKRSKDKEGKKAKTQLKSKYTEKQECLFRTKVPPNKSALAEEKSKKQSKKTSPESVVHEFAQTMTHPTFLRSNDGGNALTSTFEEGKGWVDEFGNLKESASERIRKDQYRPGQIAGHKEKPKKAKVKPVAETESTKKSSSHIAAVKEAESTESEDWTSSSGSSSESDTTDSEKDDDASCSSSESEAFALDLSTEEQRQAMTSVSSKAEEPEASAKSGALPQGTSTEAIPQQASTEVHPLEALFKKPADQKSDVEPPTQFSFFGQGDAESGEEEELPSNIAPLTPFTKRDLQDRGLRSAAPTPDTSQVAKIINWNAPEHSISAGGEDNYFANSPVPKSGTGPKEESDFAKWFWENRGDNNPPASFCKCTCFSNSTIIPLDPDKGDSSFHGTLNLFSRSSYIDTENEERAGNYRSLSCNDCNRKFCLGYDLPTCKGAKEDDVFTTCFQRDSRKDEAIVFIFIIATGSLLLWAVIRPWVQKWMEAARERRTYIPVSDSPRL